MASSDVSSFMEKANEIHKEIDSLNRRLQELMDNVAKLPKIQPQQTEPKFLESLPVKPKFVESIPEEEVEAAQLNLFERVALSIYDSDEESPDDSPSDFSPSEVESLNHRIHELMDNFSEDPQIHSQQESPDDTPELPPVEDPPAKVVAAKEDHPDEEDEEIPLPVEVEDDEEEQQQQVDGVKVGLKQLPPFQLKGSKWRKEGCHLEVHKFRVLQNNEKVGWCRLVVATSSMDLVEVEDGDEEIIIRKHPRLH